MRVDRLENMVKGWIVGDFEPSVLRTPAAEFGIKHYKAGEQEAWHYHKVAAEITVIVSGVAAMNGREFREGDIILLEPGDGTDFRCLTDVVTAVFKLPSVMGDKYTERP